MVLHKWLVLILLSNHLINVVGSDDPCTKGFKVFLNQRGRSTCVPCTEGNYQSEENDSQECMLCTECVQDSGSEIEQECTSVTNTICRCREGFVAWDTNKSTCKCDIGSGLSERKPSSELKCSKCEEGYFSARINTQCTKWKNCKSAGVQKNGTSTSDAICNAELKSDSDVATTTTPNNSESLTSLTNRRPHGGAQTLNMITVHATAPPPPRRTTQKENRQTIPPSSTGNHSGWTFVILGIVALLVILTAVTCRLHIIFCYRRNKTGGLQTKDSTCRRPVEESGDSSELSLKQNPEEP